MSRTAPLIVATAALSATACLPALGQMLPWPGEAMPELPRLQFNSTANFIGAVAGDLDGDGREDVVFGTSYVGPGSYDMIIMYSRADGFDIVELPATAFYDRLAIGDFDGDGRSDIAGRDYYGEVTVYFQQAAGGFAASAPFQLGEALDYESSISAVDLNGDGRSELVVNDYFPFDNDPFELYTIATMSWQSAASEPEVTYSSDEFAGPAQFDNARGFIDWDGDGALDFVSAGRSVSVALASGVADPFAFGPGSVVRPYINDVEYYLADANGDGVDDLLTVYSQSDESFVELLGPSSGVTIPTPQLRDPTPSHRREPLTRAGFPGPGGEQMIRGLGEYGPLSIVPILPPDDGRASSFIVPTKNPFYDRAVAADVNGDARDDLVFYPSQGQFPPVLYLASDTTDTMPRYRSEAMPNGGGNVHVTDLNDDGTLDIVSGNHYMMRDEAGTVFEIRTGAGNGPYFEGDFDGNGIVDIGTSRNPVHIQLNPGGPLGTQSKIVLPNTNSGSVSAIGVDMDSDGVDETVVSGYGPGTQIFKLVEGVPVLLSEQWGGGRRIFENDVNRDGHPDIVGAGDSLVVWLNNGTGGLLPGWVVAEDFGFNGNTPISMAMGDIDGDGYNDFVGIKQSHSIEGTARVVWGGPGGFSAVQPVDFDYKLDLVRIADVDGDGLSELIASQVSFPTLTAYAGLVILKQTSPRQFEGRTDIIGGITQSFEFRDMNSDGVMDAVINSESAPTRIIHGATTPPEPCPADINADGLANFADLIAYLGLFNAGDAGADLADPIGVVNFTDFVAYLGAFNAGCP